MKAGAVMPPAGASVRASVLRACSIKRGGGLFALLDLCNLPSCGLFGMAAKRRLTGKVELEVQKAAAVKAE